MNSHSQDSRQKKVRLVALVLILLAFFVISLGFWLEQVVLALVMTFVVLAITLILDWQWNVHLNHFERQPSPRIWLLGILLAIILVGLIGMLIL
jgi:uncharacterized membrane protein